MKKALALIPLFIVSVTLSAQSPFAVFPSTSSATPTPAVHILQASDGTIGVGTDAMS